MNPKENSNAGVQMLLALRKETDPLQVITEYLKVKEMGPADHIRTKHEVKGFVQSGDSNAAQELLARAQIRRQEHQNIAAKISQQHGQRMDQ
jgi:hypothetical protein